MRIEQIDIVTINKRIKRSGVLETTQRKQGYRVCRFKSLCGRVF